jgi:phospholipid/cholesterol/gamma-HCH transport system ATP-binding protein
VQIRLEQVSKRFGDLVVLDRVDLTFPEAQTTSILGPSGAGKSVLVKHVVGLLEPDSGHVWCDDVDMATASRSQKQALRRRFGMLFQDGALFEGLTAGENVAFPLRYHTRLSESERRERAQARLEQVDLPDVYDRPTPALSGGQRKRVALARAIVLEPEVVFFDEPSSGLDPMTAETIDALIVRMKEALGITFVVITHDIVSALRISDRIGVLYGGRLVAWDDPESLRWSRHEVVRRFLGRFVELPDEDELDGPIVRVDQAG